MLARFTGPRRAAAARRGRPRIAHTADVLVSDGHVYIGHIWSAPRLALASSRPVRRWVCAGLLGLRRVMATWGALGLPLRLGVHRTLRSFSRLLQ